MKFPALRFSPMPFVLALALCVAAPALAGEPVTVSGAQIGTAADLTVVRISLTTPSGAAPTVSPFRQSNPERLVLDIAGATLAPGSTAPVGGVVARSEFSSFNDGSDNVRLTLYLDRAVTWDVKSEAGAVVLTLTPGQAADPLGAALAASTIGPDAPRLSGPAAPINGPALRTLDFQQRERVSRILIGSQQVEPQISQPEKSLITVDLAGATMPESLTRELNSAYFYSAVDSVKAYTTRSGVRIAIRLREGAEYSVAREGDLQVISIQIPQDQVAARDAALDRGSAVAPSTPATNGGEGLSNSSGGEMLLNGKGNAIDAQSSMGSGGTGGASDLSFATDVGDPSTHSTES